MFKCGVGGGAEVTAASDKNRKIRFPRFVKRAFYTVVILLGLALYLNVGYLFAYSLNANVRQTAVSEIMYKISDFYGVMGRVPDRDVALFNTVVILWPLSLIDVWVVNIVVLVAYLFGVALQFLAQFFAYVFTGGLAKWLGFVK